MGYYNKYNESLFVDCDNECNKKPKRATSNCCSDGCDMSSDNNTIEVLINQLKREVKNLMSETQTKLLCQDKKIAETCTYIKNNLSNYLRDLLDSMLQSGEIEDIIKTIINIELFENKKLIVIGDSYSDNDNINYPGWTTETIWTTKLAKYLNCDLVHFGENGSGYTRKGENGNTFIDQLNNASNDSSFNNDDVAYIVILGGQNDLANNVTPNTIYEKADELIKRAKILFTNAKIYVNSTNCESIKPAFVEGVLDIVSYNYNLKKASNDNDVVYLCTTGVFLYMNMPTETNHPSTTETQNEIASTIINAMNGSYNVLRQHVITSDEVSFESSNGIATLDTIDNNKQMFIFPNKIDIRLGINYTHNSGKTYPLSGNGLTIVEFNTNIPTGVNNTIGGNCIPGTVPKYNKLYISDPISEYTYLNTTILL